MGSAHQSFDLTLSTTPTSLYSLLAAIDANVPRNVTIIEIQGDDTNAVSWIVGDSNLATNRYGFKGQSAGDIFRDSSSNDINNVSLTVLYIRSVSGTPLVHVRIRIV